MPQKLKLTIELVPSTVWNQNLRAILPKIEWDALRKKVYGAYGNTCGICKAAGTLHAHEIWDYDDTKHIQSLKGLIALCALCHHIKHIGFAGIASSKGGLDFEKLVHHFMKVNACDRQEFQKHYSIAFETWEKRCHHDWDLDLGILK